MTVDELRDLVEYDPESGVLRWRKTMSSRAVAGQEAGNVDATTGYRRLRIRGVLYRAHHAAWALMTNTWPTGQLDHVNADRQDNRWCNLREASTAQNRQNLSGPTMLSKTRLLGVRFDGTRRKPWRGEIVVDGVATRQDFEDLLSAACWVIRTRREVSPFHRESAVNPQ